MMSQMLVPTLIMLALAAALLVVGARRGDGTNARGLRAAFDVTVQVLPMLIAAFVVAGMIQALLPKELVAKWVGTESGMRGILIGTIAGGLTPGGPYVSLPIVAGLMGAGAGVGTMVAFVTSWSLWAVSRLPLEFGILGWRFTLIRLACTFFFPPIAGLIAHAFFGRTAV